MELDCHVSTVRVHLLIQGTGHIERERAAAKIIQLST